MLISLLSLLAAQSPVPSPTGPIFSQPSLNTGAFYELGTISGAGMGTACACAGITGTKGQSLTFARAGNATCFPLGNATSGITDASLVECAGNQPRVVRNSAGDLGLRTDPVHTNLLPRFIDYTNAAWTAVGTIAFTGAQVSPWTGTYANLAVLFNDTSAATFGGVSQPVTVTAAQPYTMSCLVKAGNLASATISLDGTTASLTGLSATTWSLIRVTDASSSGVAITAQVLNGSIVGEQGTVIWGGCAVEAGLRLMPMVPTVAASASANADRASQLVGTTMYSVAATSDVSDAPLGDWFLTVDNATGANSHGTYVDASSRFTTQCIESGASCGTAPVSAVLTFPGLNRGGHWRIPLATNAVTANGVTTSNADGRIAYALTTLRIGGWVSTGGEFSGIITRVCADPDPSRCR